MGQVVLPIMCVCVCVYASMRAHAHVCLVCWEGLLKRCWLEKRFGLGALRKRGAGQPGKVSAQLGSLVY